MVVNGTKLKKTPSKTKKDLRWDYEQDRKAQAIFGKIKKKQEKDPISKCPKCGLLEHEGVRGLLVAVGRCNTQVRLSLIYVPGQPPRPPVPGIL